MIVIRLKGGMGNQMFQYAFAKGLAASLNTEVKIDCSQLLDRARGNDFVYRDYDLTIFQISQKFYVSPPLLRILYQIKSSTLSRWIKKVSARGKQIEKEKQFKVDQSLIDSPKDEVIYEGWWQSEKYFKNVEGIVRKEFAFKKPLSETIGLEQRIKSTNSVCLNVRRTDFLTNEVLNATNKEYFIKAVEKMSEIVESPNIFIFSDDTKWCEENLDFNLPTEVVQHDLKGEKFGNYMQLMILCKHFIIPNSSFAWWAAWLNNNKSKKVIAPKNWFNDNTIDTSDMIPKEWIRL